MDLKNLAYLSVISIAVITALIYGQSLLVPFLLGSLLWFIMHEFKAVLDGVPFVKRILPSWVTTLFSSLLLILFVVLVVEILIININSFLASYDNYGTNIEYVLDDLNKNYNLNIIEIAKGYFNVMNFGDILSLFLGSLSSLMSSLFMVLIYSLFVLLEETNFTQKMASIFPNEVHYNRFMKITEKIENSVAKYFKLKTSVSLLTGALSYVALLFIGVDAPGFWAFLIFILNFIPTIGSLGATILPAVFCILQFGELSQGIIVLAIVGSIQVIIGNIVEPRVMGSSMNISPLVTIIALSFWGLIWGIIGMILSVPITVVMIIIMGQFQKTKNLAILLSEKGVIET